MAHDAQRVFVEAVRERYPEHFTNAKVVEIGSLDINGTVRDFFTDPDYYVGVDVGPGPGVDIVDNGALFPGRDDWFDVSISTECFEHNPDWVETFKNMIRMTRQGGLVILTFAGEGRPEHGTSRSDVGSSPLTVAAGWEYYKNLMLEDLEPHIPLYMGYSCFYEPYAKDTYFVGMRGGLLDEIPLNEHWVEQIPKAFRK